MWDTWFQFGVVAIFHAWGGGEDMRIFRKIIRTSVADYGRYDILFFWVARMALSGGFTYGASIPCARLILHSGGTASGEKIVEIDGDGAGSCIG